MEKDVSHISALTSFFLVATALFIDILQVFLNFILIGLVLNWLVNFIAVIVFALWFSLYGISFGKFRFFLRMVFSLCAEMVPLFNTLPVWTMFVVSILVTHRLQEKKKEAAAL